MQVLMGGQERRGGEEGGEEGEEGGRGGEDVSYCVYLFHWPALLFHQTGGHRSTCHLEAVSLSDRPSHRASESPARGCVRRVRG